MFSMYSHKNTISLEKGLDQSLQPSLLQDFLNKNTECDRISTKTESDNNPSCIKGPRMQSEQFHPCINQCIYDLDVPSIENIYNSFTQEINGFLNDQSEIHNTMTYTRITPYPVSAPSLESKGSMLFLTIMLESEP